jgi:hypothetical protein
MPTGMMPELDGTWIILSLVPSGIGFVLFTYGKKMHRTPQLVGGIALMVYPIFTPTSATLVGVGTAICVAVWSAIKLGW